MSKPPSYLSQIVPDPAWFRWQYYCTADFMRARTDAPANRSIRQSKAVLNKLCEVLDHPDRIDRKARQWEAVLYLCRYPRLLIQSGWDAQVVSAWVDVQLSGLTAHERLRLAAAGGTRREAAA